MKRAIILLSLAVFGAALFVSCGNDKTVTNSQSNAANQTGDVGTVAERQTFDATRTDDPVLKERLTKIQAALKLQPPILQLDGLDAERGAAQDLAIKDARFVRETRDAKSNEPFLNEIFGVYPMRESDYVGAAIICKQTKCFRVEMYNFALNLMTTAVIDSNRKQVLQVARIPNTQPDIPDHLTKLALYISTNAKEVIEGFGAKPTESQSVMANTKTSLNQTKCERSQHLCVAPTFVKDDKALWAIVDLTDLTLVGTRWTQVGTNTQAVTEKGLQNDVLIKKYCETSNKYERGDWKFDYILTSSDGLRISNVRFKDKLIIRDAKLVDWHVNYSKSDNFGYSDAVGCPVFSQAAVVAVKAPRDDVQLKDKDGKQIGFVFEQEFWSEGYPTPCNYYYEQHFEFYDDGRFRPAVASVGRGCGNDGTYRPVTRIALADDNLSIAEWKGSDWQTWQNERWLQQNDAAVTKENYLFKVSDASNKGFYIEPGRGQFPDGGRGDNAFIYATRYKPDVDEGESDLATIGPCCNTDYHQGPEKYIEPQPENIENSSLVLWYVAQLKNDDTKGKEYCWAESYLDNGVYKVKMYPCFSGPMFHPIQ
ncbi:MAG: hypothetical protein H7Z37_10310 [Pyrinomonadaceae bacterium]|nr:hypothetical protein [Pyrinomonadaceae bacterium]